MRAPRQLTNAKWDLRRFDLARSDPCVADEVVRSQNQESSWAAVAAHRALSRNCVLRAMHARTVLRVRFDSIP